MKPPGGESHDLWGASFNGTPSHHRVLKPPGGGSSDIFGTTNDPEPQQRKTRNHLTSSIFGGEESQTPARKAENHVATTNGDKAEPVVNGSSSAPAPVAAPVVTPAAPSATSAPPSRQRVPPGGFSSGLW
ncbi:jupiter microtubule associated homolog 2-like isoform X2 [Macrosteles quadrilineatus]|nr:jupiter microtubule associated homolog 2-like isoform X2 [Macrosteles quadrilineatus]XP_054271500.1 jupiter microtubule associated homolog 2-like isoform X2 [Macrosteles quadrilineatus]